MLYLGLSSIWHEARCSAVPEPVEECVGACVLWCTMTKPERLVLPSAPAASLALPPAVLTGASTGSAAQATAV